MNDNWIHALVDRIHREYPRVLAECNDQTPLPWLTAVVREAMPPAPRCDGCRHWDGPYLTMDENGRCLMMYEGSKTRIWPSYRDDIVTAANFGCVQWEAK